MRWSQGLIVCLLGISLSALGAVPNGPHIAVIGRSRVAVKPNQALLALQITVETQDLSGAKQQIDRQVTHYLTFLKRQGITPAQIDASRLWSQRADKPDPSVAARAKPYYRLSRQLTIRVQQLTQVEPLLAEALRIGLQELSAVQFGVADESQYRQQARKLAIQDAIQQAEQIAQQFASRRGAVYSIRYQNNEPAARGTAFTANDLAQSYLPPTLYFTEQVEATFLLRP